jgi:uncharacterized protein (TIGR02145 family)
MRRICTIILSVIISYTSFSQSPQKLSYQAIVRNSGGTLLQSSNVGMRISILQGSATGTAIYVETQTPATNANGLVTIEVGSGTVITGIFATIDWSSGTYYVKTETDPSGGTTYTITGTSQLLSVPYALYARTSGTSNDVQELKQQLTILEDNLITAGTYKLSDIEGNQYNVVKIGTQVWMKENLKTGKYNDGISIPLVTDGAAWSALITPGYCWYNNNAGANKATYGAMYNWYAADGKSNGGKNICPVGWHVPSDTDWTTLTTYLGGESVAGGKLKETGTLHWLGPNTGATNESGFTALAGGIRYVSGLYDIIGIYGYWWSSSENSTTASYYRNLLYNYSYVYRYFSDKRVGYSVRCIRDL